MTTPRTVHNLNLSRRGILKGAVILGGGALAADLAAPAARAGSKVSLAAANYQTTPKGNQRCNVCSQWIAPTDCKVVVGPVSPTGWCSLFAPKW